MILNYNKFKSNNIVIYIINNNAWWFCAPFSVCTQCIWCWVQVWKRLIGKMPSDPQSEGSMQTYSKNATIIMQISQQYSSHSTSHSFRKSQQFKTVEHRPWNHINAGKLRFSLLASHCKCCCLEHLTICSARGIQCILQGPRTCQAIFLQPPYIYPLVA